MPGPIRTSSSTEGERKVQPPRPANAWILYRSHHSAILRQNQGGERMAQSTISRVLAQMWREEDPEVKRYFEKQAEEAKLKHQQQYPGYRFCPQKKGDKLRAKRARAKKAKARDATPFDASASSSVTPALPPVPAVAPPSLFLPENMLPHYELPETSYGPYGPSPPLSAAPSPVSHSLQLPSDNAVTSTSSSLPVMPFSGFDPLSAFLQPSAAIEQLFNAPAAQVASSEYTVVSQTTAWNHVNEVPRSTPQNSEVVELTIPVDHDQDYLEFHQSISSSSQLDDLFSVTNGDDYGFNTTTVDSSNVIVRSADSSPVANNSRENEDREYLEFQKQMTSFTQGNLATVEPVAQSPYDELESIFRDPSSAFEPYTAVLRDQSSIFPQDIMNELFNFNGTESVIAPQQTHLDNTQHAASMAIFTQMTNASPASPVGGSWKSPFHIPEQTEDPIYPWTFPTN